MQTNTTQPAILVIKLGALGDIIQALDSFHDIRRHHADARIVLLTTPPFAAFCQKMPWFDAVWANGRVKLRTPIAWLRALQDLRRERFERVYDLQCNDRTASLFTLMGRPPWVGTVTGCAFPLPPQPDDRRNNADLMRAQLATAGVPRYAPTDLSWLAGDLSGFTLPQRFVVMVPGCSPHLLHKRWPPRHYAALGHWLAAREIATVLVGTAADHPAIDEIRSILPAAYDLSGKTTLLQLGSLFRQAEEVVGNDTGPVFMSASIGAPTLMLMSHHTDPLRSAPRGPHAGWLKRDDLATLSVDEVAEALLLKSAQA